MGTCGTCRRKVGDRRNVRGESMSNGWVRGVVENDGLKGVKLIGGSEMGVGEDVCGSR